jgi:predicted transcriptional regulator
MKTLRIGIASYEKAKARTMAIARGEHRPGPNEPKVWFPSVESVAKVLSSGNRELLDIIMSRNPASLDELAVITGRHKSNLSRTLHTMESYGIVRLDPGARGRLIPSVLHSSFSVDFDVKDELSKV